MNIDENKNSAENKATLIENNENVHNVDTSISNSINDSKKTKRKKIILITTLSVLLVIGLVFGISYYNNYKEAEEALKSLNNLVIEGNYPQAIIELKKYKNNYDFGKFPEKADKKIEELYFKADKSFREGLKILKTDDTENFEETKEYFEAYKIDFSYSKQIDNVDKLLDSISDYNELQKKVYEAREFRYAVDQMGDVLTIIEDYINEIDALHVIANKAINEDNSMAFDNLLSIWRKNSSYYYDMMDDVDNVQQSDKNATFFTQDEYETIGMFIANGLLPAEAVYNSFYGLEYYDERETQVVRDSWDNYLQYKSQLINIISERRQMIDDFLANLEIWEQEAENKFKEIKDFSLDSNDITESTTL